MASEALITLVVDRPATYDQEKVTLVRSAHDEVRKLAGELMLIEKVLADAEQKQVTNDALKVWLAKLKDVAYDAEDVLDELNTKTVLSRLQTGDVDDNIASGSTSKKMASEIPKKPCTVIDGKAIAQTIHSEIASEVQHLSSKYGKVPGLAVVVVGSSKDSDGYVNMKRKACAEVGIKPFAISLHEKVSEAEVIQKIQELNVHPDVHGILVQLPLPVHINEENVLNEISIEKDVDGFHPLNISKLGMKGRGPLFQPCTPKGCLELLSRSGVSIKSKRAVVVGRSNIVGLPVAMLLLDADATITVVHSVALLLAKAGATVTIVHSCTPDPQSIIRESDIIIAAAGQANMIKGNWIKPGAAIIDVGTNAVVDPSRKSGYRLVGDVDFEEACKVAGWVTPVPGGIGPMTVAMLLKNTLDGAKRKVEP